MTTQHTPITPATINGQSYFRVPLPSGMCAFVKFEEEANKLQAICNAHEELVATLAPFAKLKMPASAPDEAMVCVTSVNGGMVDTGRGVQVTVGDIRRAANAIAKVGAK